DPAGQGQDEDHDDHHAEQPARVVAPPAAVRPTGYRADEQHDQDDEQKRGKRHGSLLKARRAPTRRPLSRENNEGTGRFRSAGPRASLVLPPSECSSPPRARMARLTRPTMLSSPPAMFSSSATDSCLASSSHCWRIFSFCERDNELLRSTSAGSPK